MMTAPMAHRRLPALVAALCAAVSAPVVNAPPAWAEETVTYEVVSDHIRFADIEYQDAAGRLWAVRTPLPWRIDATVRSVREAPPKGSQVRAHWRADAAPGRWVTVRVVHQGEVICQNTLDLGNATCYGITQRIT